jgi:hypothetical protein
MVSGPIRTAWSQVGKGKMTAAIRLASMTELC